MRWLALLGFAGCVVAHDVPCGDVLCPAGMACVADRCASSEQLAACATKVDGDVCSVAGSVGRCTATICTPVGCGNAIVEPGEVCDDGNTHYGDGCAGDCASLEICGNGIVDFAVGETCDCGDAAHPSAKCRGPNSDDPSAECSTTCQSRYCGDATLDDLEQCDGSELAGQTCASFGYYRGTLDCTNLCRFDLAGCSGRCGDGIVEPAYGEFCDGNMPSSSCLDVGYDSGTLGCSAACSPSVATCEAFGWRRLDAGNAIGVWAGDAIAIVIAGDASDAPAGAFAVINGIRQPAPAGAYTVAAGNGEVGYAIGATSMARWSGTAWSTIAVAWTGTPSAAWASPASVYVVVAGALWRYDGTAWTTEAPASTIGVAGFGDRALAWSTSALWSSTAGGAWTPVEPPPGVTIADVAAGVATTWLVTPTGDLYAFAGATWELRASGATPSIACGALDDAIVAGSLARVHADRSSGDGLGVPSDAHHVATSATGEVVIAGHGGTWHQRTSGWGADFYATNLNYLGDALHLHVATDGRRALINTSAIWLAAADSQWQVDDSGLYAADVTPTEDGAYLYVGSGVLVNDPNLGAVQVRPDTESYSVAGLAHSGELLAGGSELLAIGGSPTSVDNWQAIAVPGYDLLAVDADDGGRVIAPAMRHTDGHYVVLAIGTTGAVVELPGTDTTTPWAAWTSPGGDVVAVTGSTVWQLAAGTSVPTTTQIVGARLTAVGGTALDDVFVGGAILPFSTFTGLSHFDGHVWMPVRLAAPSTPVQLIVTARSLDYIWSRYVYSLKRVVRW